MGAEPEPFPNGHQVRVVDATEAAIALLVGFDGTCDLRSQIPRADTAKYLRMFADQLEAEGV